jgi:hypothetical protein
MSNLQNIIKTIVFTGKAAVTAAKTTYKAGQVCSYLINCAIKGFKSGFDTKGVQKSFQESAASLKANIKEFKSDIKGVKTVHTQTGNAVLIREVPKH